MAFPSRSRTSSFCVWNWMNRPNFPGLRIYCWWSKLQIPVSPMTRGKKLRAYARSGIPEYWIVNLGDSCVEVYRDPQGETYAEHFRRVSGESLAPLAFPNRAVAVADILP